MSKDGYADSAAEEEPEIDIKIKTLMGTVFEIKVLASETIADVKRKIYRIEGIPIYQQSLIFQSSELKDCTFLDDAGIRNGSTLTLVAAMRGGPISTKRLAITCEHHIVLKELKELLENTKEEIIPGSKVSVLVFKEGDVISLVRVIENEDGSYSPYSEKPISAPFKPSRRENSAGNTGILERFSENKEMTTKIANLRRKMDEMSSRKLGNGMKCGSSKNTLEPLAGPSNKNNSPVSYTLLSQCRNDSNDSLDLKICERNFEEENEEEVALKDKHRSKLSRLPRTKSKSLYNESKGAYSHTKHNYARIHKKTQDLNSNSAPEQRSLPSSTKSDDCDKPAALPPTTNRIHLTRLVLSEPNDRPKNSNGIELEENVQDLWEIHESASDRLKHSATCKVGMMKRRTSHDFGFEETNDARKGEYACKNGDFEVCSRNIYRMPQLVASQPQNHDLCDYYFTNSNRSPLYGRTNKDERKTEVKDQKNSYSFLTREYSSIQQNKSCECENVFSVPDENIDELYSDLCNLDDCVSNQRIPRNDKAAELPPLIKKKSRCSECNKRLNITNMYNCRCGRLFCSQHRYSEVHGCTYDYKLEGRKALERQNPLVTAEKITKI